MISTISAKDCINQIAGVYSEQGNNEQALQIYVQLIDYIKQHFQNVKQSGGLLPLVSYNYARELTVLGRYEEAIQISKLAWEACVQYGQYRYLASTINIISECYHLLGNVEQCKDYFKQAYYVYKAIGDEHSANDMASEAHEYFGSDFQL